MTLSSNQIKVLFAEMGVSIKDELSGETTWERVDRIAEELASGARTEADLISSIQGIADRTAARLTAAPEPLPFTKFPTQYQPSGSDTELWIPLWMRGTALEAIYREAWINYGNTRYALAVVQEHPTYDTIFPGNRREDGSIRLPESEYFSVLEGYEDAFEAVGLNPDLFRSGFVAGIEMNLSPDELYSTRLLPVWEQVINAGDAIRA